jgi:pyruvate kinase
MNKFYKRTKIVATLGPATSSYEAVKELIEAGANVFRLNTSHGDMENHKMMLDTVRRASADLGAYTGIMVDLQGPKIRIGKLEHDIELNDGDELVLAHYDFTHEGDIPADYKGLAKDVGCGDKILIDDGRIELRVASVENNRVFAYVINGGILKSRKGINIPGTTTSLDAVTEQDIRFIEFAVKNEVDYIALSFVREKSDVNLARKYAEEFGGSLPIIAKIEKPQAIEHLKEIISVSDYIMVARGDLGIEMSNVRVPIYQKEIIQEATRQRKGVIVATQMLESMIAEPIPTRAEASDVANAIIDGADAVMLSAETSVGKFPQKAVSTMCEIAKNIEESAFFDYNLDLEISDADALTRQAVVFGADKMVQYVGAKAIINFSEAGYSSRLISKLKPSVPIITISNSEKTCRKLALNWGVFPYFVDEDAVVDAGFLNRLDKFLLGKIGFLENDYVILIGSAPRLMSGRTNFIRVHRIGG